MEPVKSPNFKMVDDEIKKSLLLGQNDKPCNHIIGVSWDNTELVYRDSEEGLKTDCEFYFKYCPECGEKL